MLVLLILAWMGGVLTMLSLCILPVLPCLFARADRSLACNGLPMLGGMVFTCAVVATLAAIALWLALQFDTGLLTRVALASTGGIVQKLIDAVYLVGPLRAAARATGALSVEGELAAFAGAAQWLNRLSPRRPIEPSGTRHR
jgi:hypothetical protein